jgi:hypothetical protein
LYVMMLFNYGFIFTRRASVPFNVLSLVVIGLISTSTPVAAQGDYLDKGQNGSEASFGVSVNSECLTPAAGIGQSFRGVLDVGLAVGRGYLHGGDLKSLGFQPWISYHILKQDSASSRISAALTAGYLYDTYSSESLDRFGWRTTGNHVFFGSTVYGRESFPPRQPS